ncbi:MAG: hypothetical protein NZ896_00635 [Nitrososphaerales archaeon]|nr:hypothetical protein [Nitrososphaerales archaeon]
MKKLKVLRSSHIRLRIEIDPSVGKLSFSHFLKVSIFIIFIIFIH